MCKILVSRAQRRQFLLRAGAAATAMALPGHARTNPKPVLKIIVPFSAGGATDRMARALAQPLSALHGSPVVIENRPGANTIIAAQAAAAAPADGHTLLMATDATLSINPFLYKSLPYDPVKDFALLSLVARIPSQIMVHPDVPARSVAELLKHLRVHPGRLNYGSFGRGSTPHLATATFMARTGTEMTHIPYKGVAECVTALLAGEIQVLIASVSGPLAHVRAGRIRPLLSLSEQRHPLLPDVPTAAEAGLGDFRWTAWYGLVAPARTPAATLAQLQDQVARPLRQADFVHQEIVEQALEPVTPGPAAFATTLAQDRAFYARVIQAAGVQLD